MWAWVLPGQAFTDAADTAFTGRRRYFNFRKAHPDRPAPTILAVPSLFDWKELRLLTIPEVRRPCSFPDDFWVQPCAES